MRMLYLHRNLQYGLNYVSTINVLGAANHVNLTISCSSPAEEEGEYCQDLYKLISGDVEIPNGLKFPIVCYESQKGHLDRM